MNESWPKLPVSHKAFSWRVFTSQVCCWDILWEYDMLLPYYQNSNFLSLPNGCKDNPDSWFWQDFVSSRACATSQVLLANRLLRDQHASSGGDNLRYSKRVFGSTSKSKRFFQREDLMANSLFLNAFWGSSWSLGETCSQVKGWKALFTAKY